MTPKGSKTTPRAPQNEPKTRPRGPKKRTQTARRKKDRTKTIPRPSWTAQGPICTAQPPPRGSIWEAKTAPKSIQKRSKIEAKNQERTKTIQDDLGAFLGRSWVVWGALLGPWKRSKHYVCRCFVNNHFFDVKTVRRRLWDQLWSTKAPK